MKLYLHIGMSKTGTSSIQHFLWRNRGIILGKYGILYPETGIHLGSGAHHYLKWCISSNLNFKETIEDVPDGEFIYKKLKEEVENKNAKGVIIDSEYFMSSNPELVRKFLVFITTDINIIAYFRRQDLWAEQNYSQNIKTYTLKQTKLSEFLSTLQSLYNYYNFLTRWQSAFPEAKIIPRIYDRKLFPEGNVILDFLSILGIDMPEAREQRIEANPSLSHLSTLTLRRINEKFNLTSEEHGKVVQYLFKLDREEGSPLKTFFTLQERIEFLEYFRESNERLFSEWFNCENKFVLSEDEIKFYEEQDKILKEDAEKMVEDRYRKVLAYLMEEKITPRVNITFTQKPEIRYYPIEEVEFMVVDVLQADLLKKGRINIGGLVLLKKEIEGDYRLTIRDREGEKEVKWGLLSPYLSERYPHNPKAKNARFYISGVMPDRDRPIEIYLVKEDTRKPLICIQPPSDR